MRDLPINPHVYFSVDAVSAICSFAAPKIVRRSVIFRHCRDRTWRVRLSRTCFTGACGVDNLGKAPIDRCERLHRAAVLSG
jgi:hypothetical protein